MTLLFSFMLSRDMTYSYADHSGDLNTSNYLVIELAPAGNPTMVLGNTSCFSSRTSHLEVAVSQSAAVLCYIA